MASFIFGPDQQYKTPAELAKARAVANAILMNQSAPKNVGEGLSAIGQALLFRSMMGKADASEAAGKTAANAAFNPVLAALGGPSAFPSAPGASAPSSGAADYGGDQLAWADAKPYQKALLNTISGPESGGRYDVIYGGGKFSDFSHHPEKAVRIQTGPNAGRTSSAAGKYQFLGSTWNDQASKLGLADFSPVNQDKAAWNLAAETYKAKTGQDLDAVLQSGDPNAIASVGKVLSPIWTSLPGGIEQGTNTDRFVATYQKALGAGATPAQAQQAAAQEQSPVQVASLDPSAGVSAATARPMPREYAAKGMTQAQWDAMNRPGEELAPTANAAPQPDAVPVQPGEVGGPAAVTPPGQRVLAAMMNPAPMTGGQAPMPMQAPQGGQPQPVPLPQAQTAPAAASPVAQALFGKPAAPQAQMTAQTDPSMIPATAGGTADTFDASQGASMQQLYNALQQPFLSDEQKDIIGAEIQRKQQEADPLRQLQIQAARKSLAVPPKQWQKLDDNTLFDPASGETKQIGAAGPTKFEGTGLDAQAWNILQTADPSSREYATAYAIISQPKTQLVQTENGLVPVQVPPTLPAWLKAPGGAPAVPMGNPAAPPAPNAVPTPGPAAPAAPISAPAPAAPPPSAPAAGAAIPGTTKAPTEAQLRNQQLYQVAAPELKIVENNFDALSNLGDQAWSAIPGSDNYGANFMQTPEYQRARNSLQTIIATYLYSTSGATANPGEVANQASVLMPKPGEDPTSVADKRARIRTMVDAIKTAAGGQPGAAPSDAKATLKQKYGLD